VENSSSNSNLTSEEKYIPIGLITKTIGLKGTLRLVTYNNIIDDLSLPVKFPAIHCQYLNKKFYKEVLFGLPEQKIQIEIESIQTAGRGDIHKIRIAGINNREGAEKYLNFALYIHQGEIPPAEDDEIYSYQLLGLSVIRGEDKKNIGEIISVFDYGAQINLGIKLSNSFVNHVKKKSNKQLPEEIQFPYLKQFNCELSLSEKYIILNQLDDFIFFD
jgi:16S rRNA processing protein RimM